MKQKLLQLPANRPYALGLVAAVLATTLGVAATTQGIRFPHVVPATPATAPWLAPARVLVAGDNDNDLVLDAADLDDDNDGIPDTTETTTDSDGDGLGNSFDLDSDNDGIPDAVEANNGVLPTGMNTAGQYPLAYLTANDTSPKNGLVDAVATTPLADLDQDGDTFKNRLDRDSDNDGLVDAREANTGTLPAGLDGEGKYANTPDANANGLNDAVDPTALTPGTALANPNTDTAGRPDFLDLDADDDGATDWFEAQALVNTNPLLRTITTPDADADGILNVNDVTSGAANALVPVNTDGAGAPDYLDADSDNDGVSDRIEFLDDNHDGAADFTYAATDTDNDGLVDAFDSFAAASGNAASGVNNLNGNLLISANDYGMTSLRPNADYDYLLDWRDTDDDNDGTLTSAEAVAGNYLVYAQGGFATQTSNTPTLVAVPDYLHTKTAASLKADKREAVLDWNDGTFTDGSPGGTQTAAYLDGKNFTRAGVRVSLAQFSTTSTPVTTTIPQPGTQNFGGTTFNKNPILETDKFLTYGNKLQQSFFQTIGTANRVSTAIYQFSQPIRNFTMGMMDLDYGAGGYIDDVEIVGYRNGTAVTLASTDIVTNPFVHTAGTATVAGGQRVVAQSATNFTVPSKQSAGNVRVAFSVPIDELRLIYKNGGNLVGVQIVSATDFRWANTDFDGDNVADGTQSTTADDLDSDNDGIPDLKETGNVNIFADSDNDGIPDYLDSNTTGWVDANADGVDDRYDADLDGQVNPLDRDADNDGITDTREAGGTDANGDGIIDGFADANADGLNDATAASSLVAGDFDGDGKPNYLDRDSDNDGITDTREAGLSVASDTNGDGVAEAYLAGTTPDLNFDGIADAVVTTTLPNDFDGDGKPSYLDRDSDNDGITDTREAGLADAANNGILDGATTDADNDGIYDSVDPTVAGGTAGTAPTLLNSDGTGLANYLDRDADDDGIVDAIEAGGADANGDGVLDTLVDANADGLADTPLNPADSDGDGVANYVDRDSDNDGIWDLLEAQATAGRRALANADTDGDGIDNNFDKDFNAAYAVTTPLNFDGADLPDYLDLNSDNDQFGDFAEGFDDDHNGYAINDLKARATAFASAGGNASYYNNALDTDNDKLPNYLDDDDADGIANLLDFGNTYYRDTDGDGLIDLLDPSTFGASSLTPNRTAGEADFRRTTVTTPLPVELAVFEAKASGPSALLSWTTASEQNSSHFAVERSLNGTDFAAIGTVPSQGSSAQAQHYAFTDAGIASRATGPVYYRLRQVDLDGTTAIGPVRALTFGSSGAGRPTLYPNPTTDQATLDLTAWPAGPYAFTVSDMAGRVLLVGTLPGGAAQPLAVGQLPKGAYLLTVQGPNGPVSQRLLKN